MNKLISRFVIILAILFYSQCLFSQRPGNPGTGSSDFSTSGGVSGSIVNENDLPVEYAMITVQKAADSTTVTGMLTDKDGRFFIRDIPFGNYLLKIEFMGYGTHYSNVFELSKEKPVARFQRFKLTHKSNVLGAVEVSANKEMIQNNLDKKVFNVGESITAEGASAVEVLEDIPSVSVDLDGNVSFRGSENVKILVDGRPTTLTLDQIPASTIESIEIISNPSARLEPDGMSGILNVVLKKKKESGFNGMVTLGAGMSVLNKKVYFDKYNGNVNLNYSYNKINVFFSYNFREFSRNNYGTLDRYAWFNGDSSHLAQESNGSGNGMSHNFKVGLDWFINKKNTMNFAFGYNLNDYTGNSDLSVSNARYPSERIFSRYNQISDNENNGRSLDANISYKKTFDKQGRELFADLFYTQSNRDAMSRYTQQYFLPDSLPLYFQRTETIGLNRNATAQIDFVTPIGNGGRLETGYKLSYRSIGQDYSLFNGNTENELSLDSTQANNFEYSEIINAAYLIYANTFWKKLQVQVGVRAELANTTSNLKSADTTYKNDYFNLFPTVHIRYNISDEHSLQLSYSRRVSRPSVWQLNPFIDYSDKQNIRQGNPYLKPEFANSIELGYLMNIKQSSVNITLFYRQRSNIIARYTQLLNDSTTMTSYQNLDKSQSFGAEAVYNQRLWKFWRISLSGSFYKTIINSDNLIDQNLSNDWSWNARLNQTFALPKNWDLQLNFRYRSQSLTTGSMGFDGGGVGQGRRDPSYSMECGVRKGFFNNTFTVNLRIRDLLNSETTRVNSYSLEEVNGYESESYRKRDSFQVWLTLSYKINNYKFRREQNRENGDSMMEEM